MPLPEDSALSRRIADALVDDGYERQAILDRLLELRDCLQQAGVDTLVRRLDAAAVLLEGLGEMESVSADAILRILHELVVSVEAQISTESVEAAQPTKGAPAPPSPSQLLDAEHRADAAPHQDETLLGQILKNMGIVTSAQIEQATELQTQTRLRIGDALVRIGATTTKQIRRGLRIQHHLRHGTMPKASPSAPRAPVPETAVEPSKRTERGRSSDLRLISDALIGEIFMQLGYATPAEIEAALSIQRAAGVRLGEALVQMGTVSWDQVKHAVETQQRLLTISGKSLRR